MREDIDILTNAIDEFKTLVKTTNRPFDGDTIAALFLTTALILDKINDMLFSLAEHTDHLD